MNGTLIIPAGQSKGVLQVTIIGDLIRESNERFLINFSDPVNVALPTVNSSSRVMIIDDDKGRKNSTNRNDQAVMEENVLKIHTDQQLLMLYLFHHL